MVARGGGVSKGPHHSGRGTSDIWLTPPSVIEALGGADSFDLDPCAPFRSPVRTARGAYSYVFQDGLALPWAGRVFLNPPYSRPAFSRFLDRMAAHDHGVALIFARTETRDFFDCVWDRASGLLFLKGRLAFLRPDGSTGTGNSGAPSVLCAYGHSDAECLAFSGLEGQFVPLRLPRFVLIGLTSRSWRDEVRAWLRRQRGPVALAEIYRAFAQHPKAAANQNVPAKIRQVLQRGAGRRVGRGQWEAA